MILEFVIENFRSIDKEQVLSFYTTGTQGGHPDNTVCLPDTRLRLLKSVGLYGANASGKTNILRALWALRMLVRSSHRLGENDQIPWYDPCVFSTGDTKTPTKFEIELTIPLEGGEERRFLYKIVYDDKEIIKESLEMYSTNRASLLFSRVQGDTRDTINIGASLKGGDRRIAFFKNQSYLSVAGTNAGAPMIIRQVYRYFRTRFTQIRLHENGVFDNSEQATDAGKLIRFVDVGVSDIQKKTRDVSSLKDSIPTDLPEKLKERILEDFRTQYVFTHTSASGEIAKIDLQEESDGTQRLFKMFPQVVDVLVNGGVFIIDEIESGMHPFMAEALLRLFNNGRVNVGQAQLIFTTHNSNLMSQDLLRRDQIWFTEKKDGRTRSYSLADFDKKLVTPTSPYVKWYLEGRFGAVPSINFAGLVDAIVNFREKCYAEK